MVNNHRLDLISPRVLKITVRHPVSTWRWCTLALLRFERERMQLVYEFILLNKILRNRLLSEHMLWNYASFNVKSNRLTSISFNKFIRVPKYFMWPLIPYPFPSLKQSRIYLKHDHGILRHWVTSFALDIWRKKYCQTLCYKPNSSIPQCDFQCLTLPTIQKYWFLLKLKQHIKQLRKDGNRRIIACQKNRAISCNMLFEMSFLRISHERKDLTVSTKIAQTLGCDLNPF